MPLVGLIKLSFFSPGGAFIYIKPSTFLRQQTDRPLSCSLPLDVGLLASRHPWLQLWFSPRRHIWFWDGNNHTLSLRGLECKWDSVTVRPRRFRRRSALWFHSALLSPPCCLRRRHPAALLQCRSRPASKNTFAHSRDAKPHPTKTLFLSSFFFKFHSLRELLFYDVHALRCGVVVNFCKYAISGSLFVHFCIHWLPHETKGEWTTLKESNLGANVAWFSALLLSGLGCKHRLVNYLSLPSLRGSCFPGVTH